MAAHVIKSTSAPVVAPTSAQLGSHWIKTSDPVGHWLGIGTASVDDWLDLLNLPSGGGSGESNTTSNEGTGEGLAMAKSGVNLPFKTLKAGTNITLNVSADEVEIEAAGGGGGGGTVSVEGVGVKVSVEANSWDNTIVPIGGYVNSVSSANIGTYPEYYPVVVGGDLNCASVGMQLTASSGTPVTILMALYESDPTTGLPVNKLAEKSRVVTSSTNASITWDTPIALTPGTYWVGLWASATVAIKSVANVDALAFGVFNELSSNDEQVTLPVLPTAVTEAIAPAWANGQVPVLVLQ